MQSRGLVPNKEASIAKLFLSELRQRVTEQEARVYGPYAGLLDNATSGRIRPRAAARNYLAAVSATIAGGTSEIQRNIIAQRGLGLPRGQ
jgi:alkylation response protein AidB-like acyl-CoA dehydrogenase